jgi:hypothetical protein
LKLGGIGSNHCPPNIVQHKDHGISETNDVYWIVMELLRGDHLLDPDSEKFSPLMEENVIEVRFEI